MSDAKNLRQALIRVAQKHPEFRSQLIPILKEAKMEGEIEDARLQVYLKQTRDSEFSLVLDGIPNIGNVFIWANNDAKGRAMVKLQLEKLQRSCAKALADLKRKG